MLVVNGLMNYKEYAEVLVAVVLSGIIHRTYKYVYRSDNYKEKFNTSLIVLIIVTTMIITIIKSSLSISLGLVGIISIIRFRIKLSDYRDVGFILWGIGTGIAIGTGNYLIGLFYALLISGYFIYSSRGVLKEKREFTLILQSKDLDSKKLKKILDEYCLVYEVVYTENLENYQKFIYQIELKNKNNVKLKEKLLNSLDLEFIKFI